jgi:hypothetical protein
MACEPFDDLTLASDDFIIRRIDPDFHITKDHDTGRARISSAAFTMSSQPPSGMSVDILKLMEADGVVPQNYVTTPKFRGAICFPVSAVRNAGLRVGHDPIKDHPTLADNPYHGSIWGPVDKPTKITGSQKTTLQRAAEWFVSIPGVDLY